MSARNLLKTIASITAASAFLVGCGAVTTGSPDATVVETDYETVTAAEPGAPGAQTPDNLLVYGIYKAGDQTWFIDEGEAARAAVEDAGGTFVFVDAKMSPEENLNAMNNAIANNATGIIMCIVDQTMSQVIVDKANEAGIPIVAADDALIDADGNLLAPWVGIDAYVIGETVGEWMANYVIDNNLTDDESVGVLLMTMDTVSSVVPRTDGMFDKFTELVPGFDQSRIFRADYDGTTDRGNTAAAAVITANPQIQTWLVMGGNEEGTVGALRALETVGLDDNAAVVGLGGYLAKDEWNHHGSNTAMKAAAYFSAESVGRYSVEVLLQMINGETPPMETKVPAVMVTPDNFREIMGAAAN